MTRYVVTAKHMTEADVLTGIIREYIKHTVIIRDWPNIEAGPYALGGGFGKKVLLIVSGTDEQMIKMGKDLMPLMELQWEPAYEIKEVWKKEIEEMSKELKAGKR